jgi:hypothetical protein
LVLIIPLLILFLGNLRVFAQSLVWKEEGVIFSDPTIHNVEIIPLPDGRYRMYFHQATEMKSAISPDGRNFEIEPGIRLQGSMPSLIKLADGRWRMYFAKQIATEQGEDSTSKPNAIYSATSSDGFKWDIESGTRLTSGGESDPDNVVHPSVIALPQGGYRIYYDGEVTKTEQEFTWRILSATSSNGLTWTKDEGVRVDVGKNPLEADLVFNSHAKYNKLTGTYELYFGVQTPNDEFIDGIYLATSTDGLLFSDPIAQLTPESESGQFGVGGQTGSYQDPFVLEFTEGKRMYYWINGSGIYSALLTEEVNDSEPKSLLETVKQKIAEIWGKVKEFNFPENFELYIIPTILLLGGAAAVVYLWRSRIRR